VELPIELSGAKSSTLMWAQEYDVDAKALQQLRNIAALPWVHGVRVMPDVHLGKGATVGSVIAMYQAVSPAEGASSSAALAPFTLTPHSVLG